MNRKKVPDIEPQNGKFICPTCERDFPSKPSFSMHWYHAHTNSFKKKKKLKRVPIVEVKSEDNVDNIVPINHINFCPNCGFSLNPINMAIQLMHKYDKQEKAK